MNNKINQLKHVTSINSEKLNRSPDRADRIGKTNMIVVCE